jgi:hypothetical protein
LLGRDRQQPFKKPQFKANKHPTATVVGNDSVISRRVGVWVWTTTLLTLPRKPSTPNVPRRANADTRIRPEAIIIAFVALAFDFKPESCGAFGFAIIVSDRLST